MIQYKYIYDQFVNTEDRRSIIVAERLVGDVHPNNVYYFRESTNNGLLHRIDNLVTDRVASTHNLYLKNLHNFYRQKIKLINPALLHAHFGMVGYKLSALRKELGLPLVVTFYGVDVSYCLKNKRWLTRYIDMFTQADRFIVLCKEASQRLVDHGCPSEKIRLWNIGLDLENYPYQERRPQKPIKFLIVARFVENKGYMDLLPVFAKLLDSRKDISLTMAGFGPLKKQILRFIDNQGLQEHISLIDTTGRKDFYSLFKDLLYDHDIFVLPSKASRYGEDEGGPALTMIYAQSTGLPVISTAFPGAEISVIDGKTGLFCQENNPDSLKEKMRCIIEDARLRNTMGLTGSLLVNQEFQLRTQLERLGNIYKELLR